MWSSRGTIKNVVKMILWIFLVICYIASPLLAFSGSREETNNESSEETLLPQKNLDVDGLAEFDEPAERGPMWYDGTDYSKSSSIDMDESISESSYSYRDSTAEESHSSGDTDIQTKRKRKYRTCTQCTQDMMKRHTNLGIKWICGSYQRARRSFKSECMMRYRNCEDGTLFVKLYDSKCKNDSYHGRHYFYYYNIW